MEEKDSRSELGADKSGYWTQNPQSVGKGEDGAATITWLSQ